MRLDEPLQIASPRPWPAAVPCSPAPAPLRNRWGNSSGATPRPSSETETATCLLSLCGGDPDGRRLRRVPPGVGEEVVEHLHDATPVGQHAGQPRRQVDKDVCSALPAPGSSSPPARALGRRNPRVRTPDPAAGNARLKDGMYTRGDAGKEPGAAASPTRGILHQGIHPPPTLPCSLQALHRAACTKTSASNCETGVCSTKRTCTLGTGAHKCGARSIQRAQSWDPRLQIVHTRAMRVGSIRSRSTSRSCNARS